MNHRQQTAIEALTSALADLTVQFAPRPDGGVVCQCLQSDGSLAFSRVINSSEQTDAAKLDELVSRIRRDMLLETGPLPENNVALFTKRMPLPTFFPNQGTHRARKIVIAGDRLRAKAAL
ncbi:MAG: hypothetical protein GAK43_01197 [Stenotrophomonas maltophilia]|nr:MAG: hypothetical protein GAK43_01197 [Stenotrophomonas maltophilia]